MPVRDSDEDLEAEPDTDGDANADRDPDLDTGRDRDLDPEPGPGTDRDSDTDTDGDANADPGRGASAATAGLVVRRFEPGDGDAVRSLHRRALRDAGTDPADVPGTDDLHAIDDAYLDAGGEFLVAVRDGSVVGMGGLRTESEDREGTNTSTGRLHRLRVAPDHQREGIGTAVLRGLEAAARERGLDRLVLTTATRQTAATRFYPANGYEEVGREQNGEYELLRFEKRLG